MRKRLPTPALLKADPMKSRNRRTDGIREYTGSHQNNAARALGWRRRAALALSLAAIVVALAGCTSGLPVMITHVQPLTLTPNPVNFPDTLVGVQNRNRTLTITNNSDQNVTVLGTSISAGDFGFMDLCFHENPVMSPGSSCLLPFTFTPTGLGPRS